MYRICGRYPTKIYPIHNYTYHTSMLHRVALYRAQLFTTVQISAEMVDVARMQIFSEWPPSELRQTRFTNCLSARCLYTEFLDVYYFRINLFLRSRKCSDEFYALRGRNGARGATRVQQQCGRNKGKICKMIRVANSIASELED